MTLEQLRIFVGVAEREHMTSAARAMNITQSAASAAISSLEERHHVKLFHRVGRGIVLTEAGRDFLTEARTVLARAASAQDVLEEFGGLKRGTLHVTASQTTTAYWLPQILMVFKVRHPLISVELTIGNTEQALARVRDGVADIGIVEGETDDPAVAHWPIGEDRLLLVGARSFRAAKLDAAWLRQARWITREPGSGTASTLERRLRRLGVDPNTLNVVMRLPSNEAVRTAVEGSSCVAALSQLVVGPSISAGTLHAAPLDLGRRRFYGLRHKERYRSKASDALLEIIKEGVAPAAPR